MNAKNVLMLVVSVVAAPAGANGTREQVVDALGDLGYADVYFSEDGIGGAICARRVDELGERMIYLENGPEKTELKARLRKAQTCRANNARLAKEASALHDRCITIEEALSRFVGTPAQSEAGRAYAAAKKAAPSCIEGVKALRKRVEVAKKLISEISEEAISGR